MISFAFLLALSTSAWAGGSPNSLGVGAESVVSTEGNIGGVSANYDFGQFHLGGFFGVADPAGANNTRVELGGRFYFHLHSSAMADFSVGGSLAYANESNPPPQDNDNEVYLTPGFQIRAFVASNVALSFSAGIALGLADVDGVVIDGQVTGAAGVHYYFF
jgi:hypothetical protein